MGHLDSIENCCASTTRVVYLDKNIKKVIRKQVVNFFSQQRDCFMLKFLIADFEKIMMIIQAWLGDCEFYGSKDQIKFLFREF